MELTLTPSMQAFVENKVNSGEFRSADDVLRAGLGQLMEADRTELLDDNEVEAMYPGLQEKIKSGVEQAR